MLRTRGACTCGRYGAVRCATVKVWLCRYHAAHSPCRDCRDAIRALWLGELAIAGVALTLAAIILLIGASR